MKKKLLLIICFSIAAATFSQKSNEEITTFINTAIENKLIRESSLLMYDGFFYQAEMIVDKLLTFQPESPNYNYRKGFLLLETRKDFINALPFLLKAITDTKPHFDAFSSKEKSAPADAFYHLATCYHLGGDIDKAIENYNLFLANSHKKSNLIPKTIMKLKQCELARILMADSVVVSIKNIESAVNSKYPEYSPLISLDGSALYFTSKRPWENGETESFRDPLTNQYPEDVYVSYMNNNFVWTESKRLEFCLPKRNEATIGIRADERRIYLYNDSTGSGDIYYTDFYAQKFNKIEALDISGVNSEYWETHCYFSPDQSKLFFASDRPGGFGGRDIYLCTRINDTTWSKPINLGSKINGPFDEDAPFVSVDNKILYFSSNGEKSIGGFDVLVSDLSSGGNWSESRNVGFPFNSTHDDIFYTTTLDGLRGYMTSDRPNGYGEKDIYEIKNDFLGVKSLTVLKGVIRTWDNSPLVEDFVVTMTLKCIDCEDSEKLRIIYPRVRDGVFVTDLKPCKNYELSYINAIDKKIMYLDIFSTECTNEYREIYKELILDIENKSINPVKNYTLNGVVADRSNADKLLNVKIEVIDLTSNMIIETAFTNIEGEFELRFINTKFYGDQIDIQLNVTKENYLTQTYDLSQKLGEEEQIHLHYLLEKSTIDIAEVYPINPIYFDFDKASIRLDAKIELDKIIKIMNDNPTIEIEFESHTDCRGAEAYNMDLSKKRAETYSKYIKARITNPERLTGKGSGESKLANECACEGTEVSDCSEEKHQANRRTEFRIIK